MADTKLLLGVIFYLVAVSALISYFTSAMGITGFAGVEVKTPDIGTVSQIPFVGGALTGVVFVGSFLTNMAGLLTFSMPSNILPTEIQVIAFGPAEVILAVLAYRHVIPGG